MKVKGREIGFWYSTRAHMQIAKYCPGGDPNRLPEAFLEPDYAKRAEFSARFCAILANCYEISEAHRDPTYKPAHWEPEDFLDEISAEQAATIEAMAAESYREQRKVTVLTTPKKGDAGAEEAGK